MLKSAQATRYRVSVIDAATAHEVRTTLTSPGWGHPAHAELARNPAPCRVCLDSMRAGEDWRILFTYDPFDPVDGPPRPGPVYIHAGECSELPAGRELPDDIAGQGLTLDAHRSDGALAGQRRTGSRGELDAAVRDLFALDGAAYVHVRNTRNGCFICRLDPAGR